MTQYLGFPCYFFPVSKSVEVENVSHSVVPDSLQPHGPQPTRLLCPWDFPGKNTGVDCHSLLQRIFLTQGLNPGLLHCRRDSLQSEPSKNTGRFYLFYDSIKMITANIPIIQTWPQHPEKRGRDQFTRRTGCRLTKETLIPPNKTPASPSVGENLASAMAFAFEAVPLLFAEAKKKLNM